MTCAQLPLAGTGLPGLCHKTLPMANQNQPKTSPIPEVNVSSVKHYNITHVICMQNRSAQPADKKFNPRQHFKSSPIPLENRGPGNTALDTRLTRWRAAPPPFLLWVKTRHFPSLATELDCRRRTKSLKSQILKNTARDLRSWSAQSALCHLI